MGDYFVKLARYAINPEVHGEQRGQAFRDIMDMVAYIVKARLTPHIDIQDVTSLTRDTLMPRSHLYVELIARLDSDRNIPNAVMEALARHAQTPPFATPRT